MPPYPTFGLLTLVGSVVLTLSRLTWAAQIGFVDKLVPAHPT